MARLTRARDTPARRATSSIVGFVIDFPPTRPLGPSLDRPRFNHNDWSASIGEAWGKRRTRGSGLNAGRTSVSCDRVLAVPRHARSPNEPSTEEQQGEYTHMTRMRKAIGSLAALSLVLAACGGDDDDEDATGADTAATETADTGG